MSRNRFRLSRSFSLVEVVVAIGLVGASLVALTGLLSTTTHSAAALDDAHGLDSLGASIQCELDRLKDSLGMAGLAALVPAGGAATPLQLVGARDGLYARRADAADPAANRPLHDPVLPGIANRDRYFLIEVTHLPDSGSADNAGLVMVSARCSWPYKIPVGPATPGASEFNTDPARELPAAGRSVLILQFAVTP